MGNLIAIAAAGGAEASTLVAEIKRRGKRKAEIDRVLTRPVVDRDGLRPALEAKLTGWKRLLRSRPTTATHAPRALLQTHVQEFAGL